MTEVGVALVVGVEAVPEACGVPFEPPEADQVNVWPESESAVAKLETLTALLPESSKTVMLIGGFAITGTAPVFTKKVSVAELFLSSVAVTVMLAPPCPTTLAIVR